MEYGSSPVAQPALQIRVACCVLRVTQYEGEESISADSHGNDSVNVSAVILAEKSMGVKLTGRSAWGRMRIRR